MNFDRLVEQKIREAQADGKFNDLRGQGQPLNLDENPFEDPAWATAHHLLKEQGFRPDWLEDDLELQRKLAAARAALARARDWRGEELASLEARGAADAIHRRLRIADEWNRALDRFREALAQINQGIAALNLKAPHDRFRRLKLVVEDEIRKVLEA
jgi:hypothetical protein